MGARNDKITSRVGARNFSTGVRISPRSSSTSSLEREEEKTKTQPTTECPRGSLGFIPCRRQIGSNKTSAMESSRVFVKNLPPTISEAEFRKHFSAQGREVTDVKLIPHRRIGFVGYKSHDDAARAVKYLNKSFIRMSRIAVDLAKPVRPPFPFQLAGNAADHRCKIADPTPKPVAKDAPRHEVARAIAHRPGAPSVEQHEDESSKKRKREVLDEADPKLQEYLEVMGHATKKPRDKEVLGGSLDFDSPTAVPPALLEAGESDDEYEDVPTRHPKRPVQGTPAHVDATPAPVTDGNVPAPTTVDEPAREVPQVLADATDDDWLRSRTSRLLDLVDPDDPGFSARPPPSLPAATPTAEPQALPHDDAAADADRQGKDGPVKAESSEDAVKLVEKTSRLFLRNLSYAVTEDDVRDFFGKFGNLEEVSISQLSLLSNACLFHDEPLIGTSYATGI